MKKRFIAIILIALICVSLTGCGTDYKQLGYDTMNRLFAGEAGATAEEIKDDFSFLVSTLGYDCVYSELESTIDSLTANDFIEVLETLDIHLDNISDSNLVLMKDGAKECLRDYMSTITN